MNSILLDLAGGGDMVQIGVMDDPGRSGYLVEVVNRRQRFFLTSCKTEQEVKETVEKLKKMWPMARIVDRRLQDWRS